MVTSNNFPEKKVFKISAKKIITDAPHRTLVEEVNANLTCFLCRGYYIDATTIVECLHSFCRSCIIKYLKVKSYCPVCEMMINSTKPNIKPDKGLQDIVYKLVPGLFQNEMERRRSFYASRPGLAVSATPEQRGEDIERIIFSPEDVISFSLEYGDITDSDSISSKSSDSNEHQPPTDSCKRFLQCPAVVNISHLKKFLCMKFEIDSAQYSLEILYKKKSLPEYYTLMDIAYIYNWKRNKPLRFVYQIIDYLAVRNRNSLFVDIERNLLKCHDKTSTVDDAGPDSPSLLTREQVSEATSDTDSLMPDDASNRKCEINNKLKVDVKCFTKSELALLKHCDEDEKKSQFLNSFELTAKNNSSPGKSPTKCNHLMFDHKLNKNKPNISPSKTLNAFVDLNLEDNLLKRKSSTPVNASDNKIKKPNLENPTLQNKTDNVKTVDNNMPKENISKSLCLPKENIQSSNMTLKNNENQTLSQKRPVPRTQKLGDTSDFIISHIAVKQTVSPIKIQLSKTDVPSVIPKSTNLTKLPVKKMPELKLVIPPARNQLKIPPNNIRMDLLANNCDPTMDRSKILPHIKSPLPTQSTSPTSVDPLKSLFDSCKINIPSSLSITLTDEKLDSQLTENVTSDKSDPLNKHLITSMNKPKIPSTPVHNYIEILKLSDADPKQIQTKNQFNVQCKIANVKKTDISIQSQLNLFNKQLDTTSARGPIPSLKPIGERKLAKQSGNLPVTSPYQQKYIQSLEQSSAPRMNVPRIRMQVPNLMPAYVKQFSTPANKDSLESAIKPKSESKAPKSDVLDLSTNNLLLKQNQLRAQSIIAKSDPKKLSADSSKISFKTIKPAPGSCNPTPFSYNKTMINTTTSDLNLQQMYPQVMLRHLEWFKTQQARHQYENLIDNMPNLRQNFQDLNKDKS